jgi:hypothetical protein
MAEALEGDAGALGVHHHRRRHQVEGGAGGVWGAPIAGVRGEERGDDAGEDIAAAGDRQRGGAAGDEQRGGVRGRRSRWQGP